MSANTARIELKAMAHTNRLAKEWTKNHRVRPTSRPESVLRLLSHGLSSMWSKLASIMSTVTCKGSGSRVLRDAGQGVSLPPRVPGSPHPSYRIHVFRHALSLNGLNWLWRGLQCAV